MTFGNVKKWRNINLKEKAWHSRNDFLATKNMWCNSWLKKKKGAIVMTLWQREKMWRNAKKNMT